MSDSAKTPNLLGGSHRSECHLPRPVLALVWCCAALMMFASTDAQEPPSRWTPEYEAQALFKAGRLGHLSRSSQLDRDIEPWLRNWTQRNVPPSRVKDVVYYESHCNSAALCAACVEVPGTSYAEAGHELFGCLIFDSEPFGVITEFLMPAACNVFAQAGVPVQRPTIRSVEPTRKPPAELLDRTFWLSESIDLVVDAEGKIVAVPDPPQALGFDLDAREVDQWLDETFVRGMKFLSSVPGPESILSLPHKVKNLTNSIALEIRESNGCRERIWKSSWPESPNWKASEWRPLSLPKTSSKQE